jgi:hypothetical protein
MNGIRAKISNFRK